MAKRRTQDFTLGIIISHESQSGFGSGSGFFHIVGRMVTSGIEGQLRNPPSSRYNDPINGFARLADLRINSQGEQDRRSQGLYGFDVTYRNVFEVELSTAKEMVQTLTKLEKGLAKLEERRGIARDFGTYVGRVAEVLGAEEIIETKRAGSFYRDGDYVRHSVGDGVEWLKQVEQRWKDGSRVPFDFSDRSNIAEPQPEAVEG